MTTYFLKHGSKFTLSDKADIDLHDDLPVGTYTVKFNQDTGQYFLETIDDLVVKGKVYGDARQIAERIHRTFEDRNKSTGVLLSGDKGSGKTLEAQLLSEEGRKRGYPTIVINNPHFGEGFNTFMQMIEQPTVVIFDEFEKVYDSDDQEKMLTLLDGVYPSRKLFVLTCNDRYRINSHMKNRPGRIFYRIEYTGLSHQFIVEYCEDKLNNKSHIESITRIATVFDSFNFDILKALVEEMNRYNESPQDALKMLNAKPESSREQRYTAELTVGTVTRKELSWIGSPLLHIIRVSFPTGEVDSDGDNEYDYEEFSPSDLKTLDPQTGTYIFTNSEGNSATLVRVVKDDSAIWDAF